MLDSDAGGGHERSIRVHLDAIRHNIGEFSKWVAPANVMAVVKAGAYGHGAVPAARAALEGGASWLGVAHVSEALSLREASVNAPLLAWLHTPRSDFTSAIAHGIRLGISSVSEMHRAGRAAESAGLHATVHLKVDTGLGRNGATPDDWRDLVDCAMKYEQRGAVTTEGVFSHLSVAENATRDAETTRQIRLFDAAVAAARRVGLNPHTKHIANTAAALRRPDSHYDMVRIGIGTYGLSPLRHNEPVPIKLRRALSMHATLAAVKQLPADHGVSYGARHITSRPTLVGLVPVGYGDGLPRSADGIAVTIHGVTHPVLGVISMDQMVIGLSNDAGLSGAPMPGDEVTIIALDGENTVDQWATASSSSNYEIVTKLTRRPARVYRSP